MGTANIEKTTLGVRVTLSDGEVTDLKVGDYIALDDKMAWVSDCLGLCIDSDTVDKTDNILYDMAEADYT